MTLVAVVASTVLNALYYLPALQVLFDREPDTKTARSSGRGSALTAAAIAAVGAVIALAGTVKKKAA